MSATTAVRPLHVIADDIARHWPRVYFAARPYLHALFELDTVEDRYHYDRADDIVRRFLVNATTWRGEHARRIKAELRGLLR
jgi:hypothetical protein